MDFSWLSLLFLSLSAVGASRLYGTLPLPALYIIAALLFAALSFRRPAEGRFRAGHILRPAGLGLAQCAVLASVQGLVFPFLYWIFASRHEESLFAGICGRLLTLFGARAVVDGSDIYISVAHGTIAFSSAWEKFGAVYFILLLIGGFVLLALKGAGGGAYLRLTVVTALYAVLRYTLLLLLYTSYQFHTIFWEPVITLASLLPYALIASRMFGKLPPASSGAFRSFKKDRITIAVSVCAFVAVFFGTAFFGWHDLGHEKDGRVTVEEYHSDWEWTDEAYDENWFGERSGYNYYCFYEYIDKFYEVSRNTAPITAAGLADTDVLILKTPTDPYSDDEISAILGFVADGGGLYLIGDHTNVFGTGSNLNLIAPHFGLSFNYDCTYELSAGSLSEYDAPRLLPHPAIRDLPHFLFATSCTLNTSWPAENVIAGYGLKNLPADYSQANFFPEDTNSGAVEFGAFVQSATVPFGKGRVLAFTDSTVYSNFWMHMPGKPEMLLQNLQWLNRENSLPVSPRVISAILISAALSALAALAASAAVKKTRFPAGALAASVLAALLIGLTVFGLQSRALPPPEPIKSFTRVCFEDEYSSARLPKDLDGFLSDMNRQISTFYVWTQRIGYVPSLHGSLNEALDEGDLTVIVEPSKPLRNPEALLGKIEDGARLLILDDVSNGNNAGELLASAGLAIRAADMAETADFEEITGIPLTANAAAVIGGRPIIADGAGNAILSVADVGKGQIAVFSDPDLFYNSELGDISANLTDKTRLLTRAEFKMMRMLLGEEARPGL